MAESALPAARKGSASLADTIGSRKPTYFNFAQKSFQKQLAYKFEYFVGVFNGLLFIFIFTSLWEAIYTHSEVADQAPIDRATMIQYAVYAMLIRISMTMDDNGFGAKIRTGAISMDLIKPVNFIYMTFADALGQTAFHWFTRVAPIFLVTLFAFDAPLPHNPMNYLLAAVAWLCGYLIFFLINLIVALLSFWVIEAFSFHLMKFGLFTLFSGGIVPIDFFPDWARGIIAWLPFEYILYIPTSLFIGHIEGEAALFRIGVQALWVVVLAVICKLVWNAGQKKLVVQGG